MPKLYTELLATETQTRRNKMPTAIQGAVIVNQSGQKIKYQQKCDKCGAVKPGAINTSVGAHSSLNSSFRCNKCGNIQKIVIKG